MGEDVKAQFKHGSVEVFHGDVREVLPQLEAESVHCVVTSPPYWGLRDYGVEGQLGLERTPEQYVSNMVAVFREVKRVLRDDGTLWLNMGDSYASHPGQRVHDGERDDVVGYKQATNRGSCTVGSRSVDGLKPKDLCGIPWMLAFALRTDGWYLRQDIIWSKPNPMPESVTDRCTKAHEYLFLLSKSERYYCDMDAIKEQVNGGSHARGPGNHSHKGTTAYLEGAEEHRTKAGLVAYAERVRKQKMPDGWYTGPGGHGNHHRNGREKGKMREIGVGPKASPAASGVRYNESFSAAVVDLVDNRNKRSVWTIATQPFPEAHFATFPEDLIKPCILAGCPASGTVLDPFFGSGTTGIVAAKLHCKCIGVELNESYIEISKRRLSQEVFDFSGVTA